MLEGKLKTWQGAGLIDAESAMRIRAYEEQHARPLALWAVVGIGVLTIGLGLISVVAANWDAIPGMVRLTLHLALIAGLAGALWWRSGRATEGNGWIDEGMLFVFGILGLTFFGHVGQVYQTSSPLWQPLAAWLVLFAPVVLLRGQSWLTAALVMWALVYACGDFVVGTRNFLFAQPAYDQTPSILGGVMALPVLMAPLGAWFRQRSTRPDFWRRIEQMAFAAALLAGSVALIMASIDEWPHDAGGPLAMTAQLVQAMLGLLAAGLVAVARPTVSGRGSALVIAASSLALVLAHFAGGSTIAAGVLFLLLWVAVAAAAQMAGWRGVFRFAVAVIALRIIVLSFELASDLLTSGAGLIVAGVLILGVAWVAVRVSRRYAPPREVEA